MSVINLPERCPICKREIKHSNRLVTIPGFMGKRCLICAEEVAHKDIMGYLTGDKSPMFICSSIGQEDAECDMFYTNGRNYLQLYTTAELVEEVLYRLKNPID